MQQKYFVRKESSLAIQQLPIPCPEIARWHGLEAIV